MRLWVMIAVWFQRLYNELFHQQLIQQQLDKKEQNKCATKNNKL